MRGDGASGVEEDEEDEEAEEEQEKAIDSWASWDTDCGRPAVGGQDQPDQTSCQRHLADD